MSSSFSSLPRLPLDDVEQSYTRVSAIAAGYLFLLDGEVFDDSIGSTSGSKVPSFSFLIEHPKHGKLLFDLGLRKGGLGYPPALDEDIKAFDIDCQRDISDLLEDGDVKPRDVSWVVYSHLHFDHVGDLTPFFSAELVMGCQAKGLLEKTYPEHPDAHRAQLPHGQKVLYVDFHPRDSISKSTTSNLQDVEISGDPSPPSEASASANAPILSPIGSYLHGMDFFHDGSFYLLDAPGHLPGHLNALARIGPNAFVLLAADSCHNRLCYNPGERLISRENHVDIAVARDTVDRLKKMNSMVNVVTLLSHEAERLDEMPLFPETINEWALLEVEKKKARATSQG